MFPIMGYLKMSLCLRKSSNRQKQSIHRVGIAMSYGLHLQMMTEISVFFVSYYIFAWFIMECCILARTQVLDRLIYVLRWLTSEIISCYFWGLQMHSFPASHFYPSTTVSPAFDEMSVIWRSPFDIFGAFKNSWNQ